MTVTPMRKDSSGFTLIELMIVIVIAAILLTVAVPSFQDLIRRNTVESMQAKMTTAVSTARTEAASRNSMVTVCASEDGETCGDATDWSRGWIVFSHPDRFDRRGNQTTLTAADQPIDVFRYNGDYTFDVDDATTNAVASYSFTPQGFLLNGTNILVTICEPEGELRYARGLYVNASGLVMKSRDGNNDGFHDDPRLVATTATANLTCP